MVQFFDVDFEIFEFLLELKHFLAFYRFEAIPNRIYYIVEI